MSASRFLLLVVAATVLLQRFAIPLGGSAQLPVNLVVALVMLGVGLRHGLVVLDRRGAVIYRTLTSAGILGTIAALSTGHGWSATSLGLLLVIYLVMFVRPADDLRDQLPSFLDRFTDLMQIAAVVGMLQAALQYAGVPYIDLLSRLVPVRFLITGFNTGNPISMGAAIIRVNGVVFLEPSVLSMCLGLAAVVAVYRERRIGVVALLLVAILPTVAVTGVLVVAIGLVQLTLLRKWRPAGRLASAFLVAAAAGTLVPGALKFVTRGSELGQDNTSGSGRTTAPYSVLLPDWSRDLHAILTGVGAGSASDRVANSGLHGVLTTAIPKLLYEYGVIAGSVMIAALLAYLLPGMWKTPWGVALVVVHFAVNASLLQPTLVIVTFVFVAFIGPFLDAPSVLARRISAASSSEP